jgi:hypothetical protein
VSYNASVCKNSQLVHSLVRFENKNFSSPLKNPLADAGFEVVNSEVVG